MSEAKWWNPSTMMGAPDGSYWMYEDSYYRPIVVYVRTSRGSREVTDWSWYCSLQSFDDPGMADLRLYGPITPPPKYQA